MDNRSREWTAEELAEAVRLGDDAAVSFLYYELRRWAGILGNSGLGPEDSEDILSDTFVAVVNQIRGGQLRNGSALFGFARTILSRMVAEHKRRALRESNVLGAVQADLSSEVHGYSPADVVLAHERSDVFLKAFLSLDSKNREMLTRFYLKGQKKAEIVESMQLTETQYRLLKSRAKARLARAINRLFTNSDEASGNTSRRPGRNASPDEMVAVTKFIRVIHDTLT